MQNTDLFNGMHVKPDWLAFTSDYAKEKIIYLLGLSIADFSGMAHGARGYKSGLKHDRYDISILYDGSADMGTHVEITGKGIDGVFTSFMSRHSTDSPFGVCYDTPFNMSHLVFFLDAIYQMSRNISRLDIAIDDCTGKYLTVDMVENLIKTGCYVGKFRNGKVDTGLSLADGSNTGKTVYFGSRCSNLMIRVYDKALEQNVSDLSWVRWELELHNDYAMRAVRKIVDGNSLSDVSFGLLSNYIRFIVRDRAKRTNCSTLEVWSDFINNASKATLYVKPIEKTIKDKQDWIDRQCGRTIAELFDNDNGEFFRDKMDGWYLKAGLV